MSLGITPKNFLRENTEQVSVRHKIADALQRATIGIKSPAKVIARTTGKTPEMAEKWLRAENSPNAETLVVLMQHYDEVWLAVREKAGRANAEGEAEQLLAEITTRLRERRQV
jgi:hypothetical protein